MGSPSAYHWIEIDTIGQVTSVRFIARAILEERMIRTIAQELFRLVEQHGNRYMLLNFSEVKNLSSYMLSRLLELNKRIRAADGKLALCSLDPELRKVFEMTQLNKLFAIYPDEAEAVQHF